MKIHPFQAWARSGQGRAWWLVLCLLGCSQGLHSGEILNLAGRWRFALDRGDVGQAEQWQQRALAGSATLPGGLTEQGIGDPVTTETAWTGGIVDRSWFTAPEYAPYREPGHLKIPFWLQPTLYYAGAAWFQRDVEVPSAWAGRRVVLFLERPHWETRVWVDRQPLGTNDALATPHEYDLGLLPPGRHVLTIRVDNRRIVDVGENSHSISDHTQGNWNGIVGRVELRSTAQVWVDDLQVYPHRERGSVTLKGRLGNVTGQSGRGTLAVRVDRSVEQGFRAGAERLSYPVTWESAGGTFTCEVPVPAPQEWDEFAPRCYVAEARVVEHQSIAEAKVASFGFRDITTQGTQFLVNGRPTFFRGTLECCIFPRTGHPPTDLAEWRRILRVAKEHGLNMLRFHSWCPPEAAFAAADEVGCYLQVECSSWANQSSALGDGKPIDRWIYAEAERILRAYGNHPSFVLLLYGNEPAGQKQGAFLGQWVEHFKAQDSRRLVSAAAGWPQIQENQFHVTPDPRVQGWGEGLRSRLNGQPPATRVDYRDYIAKRTVPVISHEIGQWCVYPAFAEMKKYTGYLKARNFEIFRDRLEANGLGSYGRAFLLASGHLQALCYKEDIESALRTPGMGGFQLLDLHDFPGQGTALVGVLDPFWEQKGYVTPAAFRRFCNATVPLARLERRVFNTADHLSAGIEMAHYGPAAIANATVDWKLVLPNGRAVAQGEWTVPQLPVGKVSTVGTLEVDLRPVPAPAQVRLVVSLRGTAFVNDWDLWVYPASSAEELGENVRMATQFDAAAEDFVRKGGRLLLSIPGKKVRNYEQAPVQLGFSSIFWNTAWTGRQAPTTLGLLCDPKHPALAQFPTETHSNWQWWYLVHRAGALRLDLLPPGTRPIVRVIDDWVTARPLALITEGRLGRGHVLICGFDLTQEAEDPVSRQMRASLVHYLSSSSKQPRAVWTADQIRSLCLP